MLVPRLRSLLSLKTTHLAFFHSTSVLSEKPRNKSGSSSIRFTCTVKEKRSDAKKALNNLLFHTRGSRDFLQNEWHFGEPNGASRDKHIKKKSPPGRGKSPRNKKTKRWHREGSLDEEFDTETTFADKFRESWCSKMKSRKASSYSKDSTSGFEWREGFSWTNQSHRNRDDESSCNERLLLLESRCHRTVLGLPPVGPLNISDVKNAFRSSALKWHPDKHQGPSQVAAQEKFKLCVDAYKSLCSSLS